MIWVESGVNADSHGELCVCTLCFSPWRDEGLGEAPAGEQGAEESVQGESESFKGIRIMLKLQESGHSIVFT